MSVFLDPERGRWRYDFQLDKVRHAKECLDANGLPVTSRRAALAAEAEARRQAAIAPKMPRAEDLALGLVVFDLAQAWEGTADAENKNRYARELLAYFGPTELVTNMSGARVEDYKQHLARQPLMVWKGGPHRDSKDEKNAAFWAPRKDGATRGPATTNRYLPLVRAVFDRAANTYDPITNEPTLKRIPKVVDFEEPKRKARPVPDAVLTEVRDSLPEHVSEAAILSLFFGLRKGECFGLQIHHADFQCGGIRFEHQEVKNKSDDFIPGSRTAMQFLAMLVDQAKARGVKHLIAYRVTYKDPDRTATAPWRQIKSPKRAWRTAMKKVEAKIGKRWRWHDIRAAYITQVAMTSGPILAQKLARHADFATTQAYIDVADDMARAAAERASERPALGLVTGGKRA